MKTLLLAFSHCLIATIAIVAAYFYLPAFYSPSVENTHHSAPSPDESAGTERAATPPIPLLERPSPGLDKVEVDPESSIFGQQWAAHQLAAQSNEIELRQLLDQYLADNDPFLYGNLALIFLERLIELDVGSALDYAENARISSQKRQMLLSSIYTSWARYDPAAMSESFAAITDMNIRLNIGTRLLQDPMFMASGYQQTVSDALGVHGRAIIQRTATLTKPPAERFSDALNSRGMRRTHEISNALAEWYQQDPEAALNALNRLNESELQAALPGIVTMASQRGYLEGYELVQNYGPDNLRALGLALSMMVMADPQRGLPYVERHFEETGNIGLVNQALMGWASRNAEEALAYINTLPAGVRANIEPTLAHTYARENPEAAMNWARTSDNTNLKRSVASTLAHTDLSVAEQWLAQTDDPEIASTLLRDIAQQKAQLGMDRAMDWLSEFEDDPAYHQAAAALLTTVSHADPALSASHLGRFAEDDQYASAFSGVASNWSYSDRESARDWVRSLPEGNNRNQAGIGLIQATAMRDPEAALDLLDELEPEGARPMVASFLLMHNGDVETAIRRARLSDEEAEAFRMQSQGNRQMLRAVPGATVISEGY